MTQIVKSVAYVALSFFILLVNACGGGTAATGPNVDTSSTVVESSYSPVTNYPVDYCTSNIFPAQWTWREPSAFVQPSPATSGQPLIKHVRNGVVIANYSQLSGYRSAPNNIDGHDTTVGPFRRDVYTQWKDGDIFEIYPAVYEGENQQIYIGPNADNDAAYSASIFTIPKNITIRGITVNGIRPEIKLPSTGASNATLGQGLIYIDTSENVTIENLEIASNEIGTGSIGKAGIYINGGKNVTLRNIKVAGFANRSVNGIFVTGNNSGTLLLENVELANNGGGGGPEHNIYVNASTVDNNFTVKMVGSWTHDSFYGHLFKSRAQTTIMEGNYFQGSKSTSGEMRESWLLDVPEGGTLIVRNNIFVKNFSGANTNGASITYGVERAPGTYDLARTWKLQIEHNTFVTHARYFDTQNHPIWPIFARASVPVLPVDISVKNNIFVGYCQNTSTVFGDINYFGSDYLLLDFNSIDQAFRPRTPNLAPSSTIVGSPQYVHQQHMTPRGTTAKGARD